MYIGLSVRKDEMDHWNHPAPPADCVYCPLCIASVEDSDDAWLKHLSQVCPKNKRIVVNNKASSRPGSSANRPKSGVAADVRPSTGSERPGTGSARPHTGSNRPGTGSNRPSSSAGAKVDDEVDLYDANFEE